MKKILITLLVGLNLIIASCTDELDQHPSGLLTNSNYFQTEDDAVTAVDGIYAILVHSDKNTPLYGDQILYLNDLASDYMRAGANSNSPETRAISSVTYDATNFEVQCTWEQIYKGIARANIAIDNIPKVSASDEIKQRLINEAKFLRALLYFNAVQFWGEVPLVKSSEYSVEDLKRQSVEDVYDFIIQDLKDASALPAEQNDKGRTTSGSAIALLSRVYLVHSSLLDADVDSDLNNAVRYAYEVINSGQYELFANFYDAFDPAKKNGKEHIFSAQFAYGQDNGFSGNSTQHCTWSTGFNQNEPVLIITDLNLFYNSYAEGDQRKNSSYAKRLYNPSTDSFFEFDLPRFRKLIDTVNGANWVASAINVPIIRYADVYFTLAEALNELDGPDNVYNGISAYDALNEIRRRAFREGKYSADPTGSTPSYTHDLSGLTKESFRDILQQERYFEFVLEQTRWFDLVRWKKLVTSVSRTKPAVSVRNYRFPIPNSERLLNPEGLWQNYGYDGATVSNPYDTSYK
ncbi:MAG: RagB/SusD family nutrient uptake outer membrane protein [Prevotellaceae bacterium]|jgi:hypothetical protein|nr:RagB/SusD family nutrient uptake outer membrane protein [Prevotellaceae bacterium]